MDIEKLSDEAWSEYSAFQNRFSKPGTAAPDAKNEDRLVDKREKRIALAPARGIKHAAGKPERADGPLWQQFSSNFAKLSEEEKGKRRLGVMATQELNHAGDIAVWTINGSYSENFTARFELLASQAGKSLGPVPRGATPFSYWLHRLYQHLREERSSLSRFQIYTGQAQTGSQVSLEYPLVESACEASSTFCLRLQKRALEKGPEGKDVEACFQNWIENNHVSASVPAQVSERNRVSLVAESGQTPIPIEFLSCQLQRIRLPRGSAQFGPPRKFLDDVAETHELMWAITQRGLWMARLPPSAGAYIDANGMQHGESVVASPIQPPPIGPRPVSPKLRRTVDATPTANVLKSNPPDEHEIAFPEELRSGDFELRFAEPPVSGTNLLRPGIQFSLTNLRISNLIGCRVFARDARSFDAKRGQFREGFGFKPVQLLSVTKLFAGDTSPSAWLIRIADSYLEVGETVGSGILKWPQGDRNVREIWLLTLSVEADQCAPWTFDLRISWEPRFGFLDVIEGS